VLLKALPAMVALLVQSLPATAQPVRIPQGKLEGKTSVRVVPDAGYLAGKTRSRLFGSNWRDLWTTPIEVPILDLGSYAGGMTPLSRGGDQLSATLLFRGTDGKEYTFRTLALDPARKLPPRIRGTTLETFIRDSSSSLNPAAGLILAPLLEAAGVVHVTPRLVVMPYDRSRLGAYAGEFSGLPGLIEEHPTENAAAGNGFTGARRIAGTGELLKDLDRHNGSTVDARAYLRARLMDLLVGDGDRQADQWVWAGEGEIGRTLWRPVPIRQYQAFSRQDGVMSITPRMQNFGAEFPRIRTLAESGGHLDRLLLTGLGRAEWGEVTRELQRRLTDQVISSAVRQMPPEMYAIEGQRLERDLISRRNRLGEASDELYRLYAKEVDIHASQMPEYAALNRTPDGQLDITLYRRDPVSGLATGDPMFHRSFTPGETREVRLYLQGGGDVAVVDGSVASKNVVARIIGGRGESRFEDRIPGSAVTLFYDRDSETRLVSAKPSKILRYRIGAREGEVGARSRSGLKSRDTGREVVAGPSNLRFSYSPDYGALAGWGVKVEDYGFDYSPYRFHAELGGAVAYGEDFRYQLRFTSDIRTVIRNASLHLEASTSTLDNISFYGLGNDTYIRDSGLTEDDFETHATVTSLSATLRYPPRFAENYYLEAGVESRWIGTGAEQDSFMALNRSGIPGVDVDFTNNVQIGFHYDSRTGGKPLNLSPRAENSRLARLHTGPGTAALSGILFDIGGRYYPEFMGNRSAFGKLNCDFRAYVPLSESGYSRVAFRLGGQKNWGTYPYFEAAAIGGPHSIRGYDTNRFAGDASLYANSELRIYAGQVRVPVPILFGPLLFADTGRVFLDGESSSRWHTSVGGGIWAAFIEPQYSFHLAVARGLDTGRLSDGYGIYAQAGFSF
jgi:hypothetical protein